MVYVCFMCDKNAVIAFFTVCLLFAVKNVVKEEETEGECSGECAKAVHVLREHRTVSVLHWNMLHSSIQTVCYLGHTKYYVQYIAEWFWQTSHNPRPADWDQPATHSRMPWALSRSLLLVELMKIPSSSRAGPPAWDRRPDLELRPLQLTP